MTGVACAPRTVGTEEGSCRRCGAWEGCWTGSGLVEDV